MVLEGKHQAPRAFLTLSLNEFIKLILESLLLGRRSHEGHSFTALRRVSPLPAPRETSLTNDSGQVMADLTAFAPQKGPGPGAL